MGLVDLRRAASRTLSAVLRPGPSAGGLAGPLWPVIGEGCSLPFAGAAGLIELLREVFATSLPAVSVAGGARQVFVQLGDLPLEFLNALVPRIVLSPGRLRTAASEPPPPPLSPAMLHVSAHASGSCTPLHEFSRLYPVTKDRPHRSIARFRQPSINIDKSISGVEFKVRPPHRSQEATRPPFPARSPDLGVLFMNIHVGMKVVVLE